MLNLNFLMTDFCLLFHGVINNMNNVSEQIIDKYLNHGERESSDTFTEDFRVKVRVENSVFGGVEFKLKELMNEITYILTDQIIWFA